MANTNTNTRVKQWESDYHAEYIRTNRFKKYMGANENAVIQVNETLTRKKGETIEINLVGALDPTAGPNNGSTTLVGNEKAMPNDGFSLTTGVVRDAVVVNVKEEQASPIDIRNAAKTALKDLQMRYLRNDIITALGSIDGVAYGSATATQRNTWMTNNADRVLFGNAKSNVAATHLLSLQNITASMKLSKSVVSLLKRIAQNAKTINGDGIRPIKYGEDAETYVIFAGTLPFRDLKADLEGYHKDAMERGKNNPLFTPGTSLLWDDVVIREIPELPVYAGVGADLDGAGAGTARQDVAPVYLCGAQSLLAGWSMRTKTMIRKEDDYEYQKGIGFMEMRKIEKIRWGLNTPAANPKDWGMVTGYVAATADA